MDFDLGGGDNEDDPLGTISVPLNTFNFSNKAVMKVYERKLLGVATGRITLEVSYQPIAGDL